MASKPMSLKPFAQEPDDMVIATISRLNNITAAPRMRVIFAMEAATDRAEERFKLYRWLCCLMRGLNFGNWQLK